jgi:hypothetical protein
MFLLRILGFFSFHKSFSSRDGVLEICPRPRGQLEEFLVALALVSYHFGLGLDLETLDILDRTEVCSLPILGKETDLKVLPCTFYVVRSECSQQVQPAQLTAACVAEYMACSLIRTQVAWTEASFLISRSQTASAKLDCCLLDSVRFSFDICFSFKFSFVLSNPFSLFG